VEDDRLSIKKSWERKCGGKARLRGSGIGSQGIEELDGKQKES